MKMSENMNVDKTTGEGKQKKGWKSVGKVAFGILLALVVLVGLFQVFSPYPAEYLIRAIRGGDRPTVHDYKIFAERPMAASLSPFYFKEEPAEAMVQTLFEQNSRVDNLDVFLEQNQTQAFIVIQNDTILYEKYFNGASRDTIVTSFSVAKSFTSALIGAAIDDGYINSVDDPITDYLPELAERDPAFGEITIRDLLLMRSGIKFAEDFHLGLDGDGAKAYYYHNLRKLVLDEIVVSTSPGPYRYNYYNLLVLGMILERSTGMPVAPYLETRIWQPMGAEFDGSWSLDARGFEKMESGINARAIDFAKFGRLFLNNGNWDGTQILSAGWVEESTGPDSSLKFTGSYIFNDYDGYYSYLWWGLRHDESNYDYAASGALGQWIYVSPHKNLIIVRNGEDFGNIGQKGWWDMFYQFASAIELEAGD
jgi:CubicO group peptidase (beta-lactamase class C family)